MTSRVAVALVVLVLGQLGCARQPPRAPNVALSGTCAPVEVGLNKWVTPICDEPAALNVRSFVAGPAVSRGFRAYFLGGGASGPLPAQVDLRAFDGPVRDQAQVGVCWAHALSGVIDNGARQRGFRDAAVSALHVVAKSSWDDIYEDGPSRPLTMEGAWPYDPPKACAFNESSTEVWCEQSYGVKAGSWRSSPQLVGELNRADALHALHFDDVEKLQAKPGDPHQVASVLASGRAIWADVAFDRSAWSYTQMKSGVFGDYEPSRSYGHAVVIVGYRNAGPERHFLLKNSWGTDWAQGGYAWMPEHLLARHLRQAFVLRVLSSNGAAPGEPVTPQGPVFPFPLPSPSQLPPLLSGLPALLPQPTPTTTLPDPCALLAGFPMCAPGR